MTAIDRRHGLRGVRPDSNIVKEPKTEIVCLRAKGMEEVTFGVAAAGQVCMPQADEQVRAPMIGGIASLETVGDLGVKIARRVQRAWTCFRWYSLELYDRSSVRLKL